MKKRQSFLLVAAMVGTALVATACSKTATNSNNANSTTNTANTQTSSTTNTAPATPTATAGSPTAAMQASFDAMKRKDVAAFKKTVSSEDLKEIDAALAKNGKNVDDFLKEMMNLPDMNLPDKLETRNEKIDGDKATVEYKEKDGSWKTGHLVKEGGEWKMKQGNESEGQPPAGKDSGEMKDGHEK